jgi:protein-tyrosine phosphatase
MKKKESFLLRFAKRSSLLEAGLLKGMADIHSHYLPGVDDGFQTEADAVETLLQMQEWGVTRVYCTPHMMTDYSENRPDFLRERFARFVEVVPDGLAMRLAGEYMLDAGFAAQRKAGLLTLGKDFVLIEMSYMSPSPGLMNTLYELQLNGLKPILAHPERYLFMDEKRYRELKEKGCRFPNGYPSVDWFS